LLIVPFAIALNRQPQLLQLLVGCTVLNLTGDGVEPLA